MKKRSIFSKNSAFVVFLKKRAVVLVRYEMADKIEWSDAFVLPVYDKKRHALWFPSGCDTFLSKDKAVLLGNEG